MLRNEERSSQNDRAGTAARFFLAQQFDVHPNQITQWRGQLMEGATAVFGADAKADAAPAVDVRVLHAKIGELTLANDFGAGALGEAGLLAQRKAMIDRSPDQEYVNLAAPIPAAA